MRIEDLKDPHEIRGKHTPISKKKCMVPPNQKNKGGAMHILKVLSKDIQARCQSIHKTRLTSLFDAVQSLTVGKKLALVALGRDMETNSTQKHQIKRIDRLLRNRNLFKERILIYKAIAARHLKQRKIPIILVKHYNRQNIQRLESVDSIFWAQYHYL